LAVSGLTKTKLKGNQVGTSKTDIHNDRFRPKADIHDLEMSKKKFPVASTILAFIAIFLAMNLYLVELFFSDTANVYLVVTLIIICSLGLILLAFPITALSYYLTSLKSSYYDKYKNILRILNYMGIIFAVGISVYLWNFSTPPIESGTTYRIEIH